MANERKTYLDSMKGIAMLGVIAVHTGLNHQNGILGKIGSLGANGVQIFFIISAFLSFSSLDIHCVKNKKTWMRWLLQKFLRIAPLYYLAIVLSMFETGFKGNTYWSGGGDISLLNILSHIFFINGIYPYWMNSILSVEWYIADLSIFYILLPVIRKFVINLKSSIIFCAITSALAVILNHIPSLIFDISENEVLLNFFRNFWFINQLQIMALGITLYYMLPKLKIKKTNASLSLYASLYVILGVLFNYDLHVISMHFVFSIGICLIIVAMACNKIKLLDNPLFSLIGKYSYGIYLFHYMLMDMAYTKGWMTNDETIYIWILKYICFCMIIFIFAWMIENIENDIRKKIKLWAKEKHGLTI